MKTLFLIFFFISRETRRESFVTLVVSNTTKWLKNKKVSFSILFVQCFRVLRNMKHLYTSTRQHSDRSALKCCAKTLTLNNYSSGAACFALREEKTVIKFFIYVQLYSLLKHTYIHRVCISPISNWTCKNHMSGKSKAAASVCLLMARFYNFFVIDFYFISPLLLYLHFFNCRTLCIMLHITKQLVLLTPYNFIIIIFLNSRMWEKEWNEIVKRPF